MDAGSNIFWYTELNSACTLTLAFLALQFFCISSAAVSVVKWMFFCAPSMWWIVGVDHEVSPVLHIYTSLMIRHIHYQICEWLPPIVVIFTPTWVIKRFFPFHNPQMGKKNQCALKEKKRAQIEVWEVQLLVTVNFSFCILCFQRSMQGFLALDYEIAIMNKRIVDKLECVFRDS